MPFRWRPSRPGGWAPDNRDKSGLLSVSILGSHHLSFPLHGPYRPIVRLVLTMANPTQGPPYQQAFPIYTYLDFKNFWRKEWFSLKSAGVRIPTH